MYLNSISYYLPKQIIGNDYFIKGDLNAITVFGGGYSSGAMLLKRII